MAAADHSLILSSYIATIIALIIFILITIQLCVSPAYGSELSAIKYRSMHLLIALFILLESAASILHYQDTTDKFWVLTFVVLRALAVTILHTGGILFLLAIFDTLYQSRLVQQTAPSALRFIYKLFGVLYPIAIFLCVILAVSQQQIFWVHLYAIIMLLSPSALGVVSMVGLIMVIRRMNFIRRAMERTLKEPAPETHEQQGRSGNISDDEEDEDNADDLQSDDPQKHGRARVAALKKKARQLAIAGILVFFFWFAVTVLLFPRTRDLVKESPASAGTVYQEILDLTDFWGSFFTHFVAVILLMIWVWIKIRCKGHRENFTVFYLCCMGEPDPDLAAKKTIRSVLGGADHDANGPNEQGGAGNTANDHGNNNMEVTVMTRIDDDELDDGKLAELVPTISFPHGRAASKLIVVRMMIINIECLFANTEVFQLMMRKNFQMDSLSKQAIIFRYLGGDAYYKQMSKWLHAWSSNQCVLFVAHSSCPAKRMTELLQKLDFLQYFSGENMESVLRRRETEKTDEQLEEDRNSDNNEYREAVQWNKRVIGRGSDYIDLLKNQQSDYFENDQLNKSEKRNKEKQLLKSIHLIILEFLKIWQVENDEILYVDHDESITNYMKQIHLCKVLKVNTHHVGNIKLEQQMKRKPPGQNKQMYEQVSDVSNQGDEPPPNEQEQEAQDIGHPVMNHEVIDLINTFMPDA